MFLFFQVQKYISTQNKQLDSENVLFCRNGHLSNIVFICLVLFIYLVQFRRRVLNPVVKRRVQNPVDECLRFIF